jgi:putative DNA primase/helicase
MGAVIAASRMAQKIKVAAPRAKAIALSEDSLAQLFAQAYSGLLVYAHSFGQWYIYQTDTGIWARDGMELVLHWIRGFVRDLNQEQKEKWLKASVVASVEKLARRDPLLAIKGAEFDADPWLLGTPKGVADLRTGEMLAPSPTHYISKRTAVAPESAVPELWLSFLNQATNGDHNLIDYLQRLAGYCLTGETREEVLVFMHGPGGNGKGVFMNTLRDVLGEYAKQAAMQVLLSNNGDRHPTELANLNGARLVLASESPEGRRWDEERVKALTGRDAISARFMNRDFFEYIPQFKLLVASNHKPRIRTVDDAWRRRLHLVPFTHKPASPNPELKEQMKAEYPAILQWMIEGADWWIREGLSVPASISDATEEYFNEEDVIGLWFAECCEAAPGEIGDRGDLHRSFASWCRGMGHAAATMHAVTRWFKHRGYEQNTKASSRPIVGVRLLPPATTEEGA